MNIDKRLKLAIFDLDGTIVSCQSQQIFLKYLRSKKAISRLFYFRAIFWFFMYRAGFIKNPKRIMEKVYSFLEGKSIDYVESIVDDFFHSQLKNFIYPEIFGIIKKYNQEKIEAVIISNAVDFLVRKVAAYLGIKHIIATSPEIKNNIFSGKIFGDIVYGKNKEKMLKFFAEKNNYNLSESYAYSDHVSDMPMLLSVKNQFAVNPDKKLLKEAKKRGWQILIFKR